MTSNARPPDCRGRGGGDPDPIQPGKGDTGLSDNELAQNE